MSAEPLDLPDAIRKLSSLLLEEEALESTVTRIGRVTVAVIPDCDQGTVSALDGGGIGTSASTGKIALEVDEHQYGI